MLALRRKASLLTGHVTFHLATNVPAWVRPNSNEDNFVATIFGGIRIFLKRTTLHKACSDLRISSALQVHVKRLDSLNPWCYIIQNVQRNLNYSTHLNGNRNTTMKQWGLGKVMVLVEQPLHAPPKVSLQSSAGFWRFNKLRRSVLVEVCFLSASK